MQTIDELRTELRALAVDRMGPAIGNRLADLARPGVRLVHAGTTDAAAHTSQLGGLPLLAPGTQWPVWQDTSLAFLAVIDLAELPAGIVDLPASGLVNVFYEAAGQQAWGFDPVQSDGWRVVPAEAGTAEPVAVPADVTALPAVGVRFRPTLTLPGWEEECVGELADGDQLDDVIELDEEWRSVVGPVGDWPDGEPDHRIGGWPALVQAPLWEQAQFASHGVYVGDPAGYEDPRVPGLKAGAGDWRLFLQLDTDDSAGWMWGDVGRLYFLAPAEDLRTGDFDRVWMVLQSG